MITVTFFLFLAATATLYWLIPNTPVRKIIMSISSLLFIGIQDHFAALLVVSLTLYAWSAASLVHYGRNKGLPHTLGVIGILVVLLVFKYLGWLGGILNELAEFAGALPVIHFEKILMPLGISYITFKYISYITDVKWKITPPGSFTDVLAYGSLFTIFVAGPIERFERFRPQIAGHPAAFSLRFLDEGVERIIVGLFKKLVIADWIGYAIQPVWENTDGFSTSIKALALLGFSIQIYMDFSGYSDIAIGSSRFFGLKIMENFNWPYLQPNISRFWRCWHISLSDWIRDYLFFPLSRWSSNRIWLKWAVPVIAMALCGLWHGGAWHFLFWGIWHGAGLALFQFWQDQKRKRAFLRNIAEKRWFDVLSVFATFVFVTTGWILFL